MKKKIAKSLESRKRVKEANRRTYNAYQLYNAIKREKSGPMFRIEHIISALKEGNK